MSALRGTLQKDIMSISTVFHYLDRGKCHLRAADVLFHALKSKQIRAEDSLWSRTCIHTLSVTRQVQFYLKGLIKVHDHQVTGLEQKPMILPCGVSKLPISCLHFFSANPMKAMHGLHPSSLALPLTPLSSVPFQETKHSCNDVNSCVDKVLLQCKSRGGGKKLSRYGLILIVSRPEPKPRNLLDGMT